MTEYEGMTESELLQRQKENIPTKEEVEEWEDFVRQAKEVSGVDVSMEVAEGVKGMKLEIKFDSSNDEGDVDVKAVKHDDALIDTTKWRKNLSKCLGWELSEAHEPALDVIRGFVLRWIRRRTTQLFCG
mmetsp:Transcript_6843/g.10390  ORF Transcript_6843/g.10390 Transcript_6843/m.10390 type:complete len:129 (-) Transcript_6843:3852-4238(-)